MAGCRGAAGRDLQRSRVRRHATAVTIRTRVATRHRRARRRRRRAAGVHVPGRASRIETRDPVGAHDARPLRMRARSDAAAPPRSMLRQRAAHASSDRRSASHRPLDRAARAARGAGGDDRRRRRAAARARGAPRAADSRAAIPGPADSRVSRLGAAFARRSCSATSTTGCRADRSCTCSIDRLGRPPRPPSFPVVWPIVPLDRIWVQPRRALRRVFAHATPTARMRLGSPAGRGRDRFCVVATARPARASRCGARRARSDPARRRYADPRTPGSGRSADERAASDPS